MDAATVSTQRATPLPHVPPFDSPRSLQDDAALALTCGELPKLKLKLCIPRPRRMRRSHPRSRCPDRDRVAPAPRRLTSRPSPSGVLSRPPSPTLSPAPTRISARAATRTAPAPAREIAAPPRLGHRGHHHRHIGFFPPGATTVLEYARARPPR
ncbi:hypothetical protein EVG20_g11057 [Dentipellis fragilis]|uniref:Uncharacterized protein n=1 Tax=Dentipellis fragilis TaxID=205917 RepID=A0A4Y9XNI5_9AGAM|nr:hypothetical protein EVG20_g11057 [Dentipellis fragilis]